MGMIKSSVHSQGGRMLFYLIHKRFIQHMWWTGLWQKSTGTEKQRHIVDRLIPKAPFQSV